MTRARLITVLGSLALVGLAAVAWFVVLSPRLGQAAEIESQSESVRGQTSKLERDIVQLTALQEELPARMARLEGLKANFPSTAELPGVLDQIRAAAAQAGVTVQTVETLPPELLAPAAEPVAPVEGETAAPADPAAAPAVPTDGSVGLPAAGAGDGTLATMATSITVSGSYANLSGFLRSAEALPRAWLIDSIKAQGGQQGGQEITLTASGSMFVLDTTGIAVPPAVAGTSG